MLKKDLTPMVRRRLTDNRYCPICKGEITDVHDFQYLSFNHGRHKVYVFFHTTCLLLCKYTILDNLMTYTEEGVRNG